MHDRLQPIKVCCFRSGAYDDASTVSDSMRMHGYPDAYDERYFNHGENMELTDGISEALMRTVIRNAKSL